MTENIPVYIYPGSDDRIEVEVSDGSFYEQYDSSGPTFIKLTSPNGDSVVVRGEYGNPEADTEWEVVVHENTAGWKVEENGPPGWDDYDPALTVHVPTGTVFEDITEFDR